MIRIRPMTLDDVPLGLALSHQAGWNQRDADWRRAVELQPDGGFVALLDGEPAGTTTTCVFGRVAWVALVLVDDRHRRKGVARALMEHALAHLDANGVVTVRLDATPLGQPLYEQLGFTAQYRLARYEGVLQAGPGSANPAVVAVSSDQWSELAALDESVTRTPRSKLIHRLFGEQPQEVRAIRDEFGLRGLMTSAPGTRARQLGPCVGDAGALLLDEARCRHHGQLAYLDVPEGNREACRLVASWGMAVQRHLARMCRGEPVVEQLERLWASASPAKG